MSGGRYDYACYKVYNIADNMEANTPLRKAFKKHLYKVAEAMHDIEWVDSDDMSPGDEDESIRAALGKYADKLALIEAVNDAKNIMDELKKLIDVCKK